MEPPTSGGRLIGARLYIHGYIYTKNHVDKRGRTHWECTRCRKKTEPQKCRARAMTLESSDGKPIVLRGPKESKHNHESTRAEVEEAMNLAQKRWNPGWKQRPGPPEQVKVTLHRPQPQDKPVSETNEKINRIDFVRDPRMYHAFLRELKENPDFEKENIMRALRFIYKSNKSRVTAYEAIMQNLERVKRDLETLKNDPNATIKTLDGSHYSYEPVDPFERMTEKEVRLRMEQISFERNMMIQGVSRAQRIQKSIAHFTELREKRIQAMATSSSGPSTSLKCDKCHKYVIEVRSIGDRGDEPMDAEEDPIFFSSGMSRTDNKPAAELTHPSPLYSTNSSASSLPSTSFETHMSSENSDRATNFSSKKIFRPFSTNQESSRTSHELPSTSRAPKVISNIQIPPIQIARMKSDGMSNTKRSSTAEVLFLKYKRAPGQQTFQPTRDSE